MRGLVRVTDPDSVTIIGNTGDDCTIHGLKVCPDLDIVTYTLAGVVAPHGWGFKDDTQVVLRRLASLGLETWFQLGDRDLATHIARTDWLAQGHSLSEVTDRIRTAFGVRSKIVPMSDDPVPTHLLTKTGAVREFQEYFVKHRHEEDVAEVVFKDADKSHPASGVIEAIDAADLVIISPSNPVISIGPILAVPGIAQAIAKRRERVVGISPIVAGAALKGPADRLLSLWNVESSAAGVASLYKQICGTVVIDESDAELAGRIRELGVEPLVTETIMSDVEVAERLAKEVIAL